MNLPRLPRQHPRPLTGDLPARCAAFEGYQLIHDGELTDVARATKAVLERGERAPVVIFDDATGRVVEIDFRGPTDEVMQRLVRTEAETAPPEIPDASEKRLPGRPKLGVVGREVTLFPRHWDWLNRQPGGASVTLRRLVEQAKRANQRLEEAREAHEAVYRFMSVLAGNLPEFEEALRAFYAGKYSRVGELIAPWPKDVRAYLNKLLTRLLAEPETSSGKTSALPENR